MDKIKRQFLLSCESGQHNFEKLEDAETFAGSIDTGHVEIYCETGQMLRGYISGKCKFTENEKVSDQKLEEPKPFF